MVIAAKVVRGHRALAVVRTAEFAAPDDEGVVEHTAGLEVGDERGGGLIGLLTLAFDTAGEAAVVVPVLMIQLDEFHAAFGEPPGEETVGGEGAGFARVGAVRIDDVGRLIFEVGDLGDAGLEVERHLVVGDARGDLGVGRAGKLVFVQLAEAVEREAAVLWRDAGGVIEIEDRIGTGAEAHALMFRGEKTGAPEVRHERLTFFILRNEHDEGREIGVGAAETVVEPRAETRAAGNLRTRLHERHAGAVVNRFGVHRANDAEVVGDFCGVREEFAVPRAAPAVLGKLEW